MEEVFSSIDLVGACLLDTKRTLAFQKAIHKNVKNGDTVIELGTGSGIMSLFAAKAGAQKVLAIEFDPYVAKVATNNIKDNELNNIIEVLVADATSVLLQSDLKFDIVISEMITSGLVDEYQAQGLNNIHRQGITHKNTIFIPCRQKSYITACDVDFNLYDNLNLKMILHLWSYFNLNKEELSDKILLNDFDFTKPIEEIFNEEIQIPIHKSGTINALLLSSVSFLDKELSLTNTKSLNPPVIIPIEDRKVNKGDTIKVKVEYELGGGFENFKISYII